MIYQTGRVFNTKQGIVQGPLLVSGGSVFLGLVGFYPAHNIRLFVKESVE